MIFDLIEHYAPMLQNIQHHLQEILVIAKALRQRYDYHHSLFFEGMHRIFHHLQVIERYLACELGRN